MKPRTLVPVVSVRYLPTTPLELPRPCGNRDDFELSSSRAVSQALAAITTIRPRAWFSPPVVLSIYATPVARPSSPTVTSRAMAFVTMVRRLVASAGGISTDGDEKFAWEAQPRPHWPQ